jgi:hypothetical protein
MALAPFMIGALSDPSIGAKVEGINYFADTLFWRRDSRGSQRGAAIRCARVAPVWHCMLITVHLLSGVRTSDRLGGPPRRQKTSGSMVST